MSVLPSDLIPAPDATRRPGQLRAPAVALAAVLCAASLALLLGVFQAFFRDPWSMLDLRVYLWGGDLARRRLDDPYLPTYLHTGLHFTYAPIAAAFFAVLAVIKVPIVKVLMTAASVASLVGVLWLTLGKLGYSPSARRLSATLCAAAVSLWLEPVRQTLSFGQINLVLMVIIVADLCLPDSRWWKGVGVGLAAGMKLTPLIFIPYLLLTRRYRAAAVATATFGLTIAISLVALPAAGEDYWLDGLFLNANRLGGIRYIGNQSLNGALLRLLGSAAGQPFRLGIEAIVALAGLLLAAWLSRRGQEMAGILVCALTGLLISPVSWSHHWVWAAPALIVLADLATSPRWLPACRSRRLRSWLGVSMVVAVLVVFSGVVWAVPARAASGYVMTAPEQLIGDLYVLAGLVGLGVIAVLMAHARWRERVRPGLPVQATAG